MARLSKRAREVGQFERSLARQGGVIRGAKAPTPFMWPDFRMDKPQWQVIDYGAYVADAFERNALVYDAIMYKVRALSQVLLKGYKGEKDHPEPLDAEHPLSKLVSRPNPHQSFIEFQAQSTVYLNLAGNVYIMMVREKGGGLPVSMYSLRPDRVLIVPGVGDGGGHTIQGYLYVHEGRSAWEKWSVSQRTDALRTGGAFPILPQDLMHVKLPNPGDPLEGLGYGMAPLMPGARSVDIDNAVTDFLRLFFQHGTMMQGMLMFDSAVDDDEIARIKERWHEQYGGYEQWVEIGVLGAGGKYERISPTFDEMGFEAIDRRNETRILGPFGVPPILVGSNVGLERSTYSNYAEAREACWEDTLVPESHWFEVEYQYYLQGEKGEFVLFDYSSVPALKKDIVEMVNAWSKLVMSGVPKNIATTVVGLDMEALADGDIAYMPSNMLAVAWGDEVDPRTEEDLQQSIIARGGGDDGLEEVADNEEEGAANSEDDDRDDTDKMFTVVRCSQCRSCQVTPLVLEGKSLAGHYRCMKCGALVMMLPKPSRQAATSTIVRRV